MCQLTFIDFNKRYSQTITKHLPSLLMMNSLRNNDGFGFYLFDEDRIVKTKDNAIEFFTDMKDFKRYKFPNGIYHVRLASSNVGVVRDENSHPFSTDRFVLAHNGTLKIYHPNMKKELEDKFNNDMIDSEKFLVALDYVMQDKDEITPELFNKALSYFWGVFAFIIRDRNHPEYVYISKGTEKTLNCSTFYIDEKPIGVIFNTKFDELNGISWLISQYIKNSTYKITYLKDNLLARYSIGQYTSPDKLGDVKENKTFPTQPKTTHQKATQSTPVRSYSKDYPDTWGRRYYDPLETIEDGNFVRSSRISENNKMGLLPEKVSSVKVSARAIVLRNMVYKLRWCFNFEEISFLSQFFIGKDIFLLNEDEYAILVSNLSLLEDRHSSKKKSAFREIEKKLGFFDAYNLTGLNFPYTENTADAIEVMRKSLEQVAELSEDVKD